MGTPKAMLAWQGTTLLQFALQQARAAAVDDIVVVLGPPTRHLEGSLGDARAVVNPDPQTGRSASIRIGSAALAAGVAAVIIQSVDQPCAAEVLSALFAATLAGADVAIPTYAGRRGHPICVAGRLLPELHSVTEETEGLRSVVRRHSDHRVEVPVDDAAVLWNLNDPAAYAAAQGFVVQP